MTEPDFKRLSEWEMRVHGQAALRVLGLPFGVVESAARLLFWAQAVDSGAVEHLVANTDEITSTAGNRMDASARTGGSTVIDANGQHAFAVAPTALDVACANAHATGLGIATAVNVIAAARCGGLAELAARRGYACVLSMTPPTLAGVARTLLAVAGRKLLSFSGVNEPALREWLTATVGECHACPDRLVALMDMFAGLDPRGPEQMTVACISVSTTLGDHGPAPPILEHQFAHSAHIDTVPLLAEAYHRGVAVESQAADRFIELAQQLWLPTSQRSRQQGSSGHI